MMNNVGELYSLIRFLRIKPYNSIEKFNEDIGRALTAALGGGGAMKLRLFFLSSSAKPTGPAEGPAPALRFSKKTGGP